MPGTIAKASTDENSSIAWGIFYWMVNVGGFLAPMLAAQLRGETNWRLVFYCAAGVTAFNFHSHDAVLQEPERVSEGPRRTVRQTFIETITTFGQELPHLSGHLQRLLVHVHAALGSAAELHRRVGVLEGHRPILRSHQFRLGAVNGNVKPEMLINIDSFAIIALMLPMAWLTGKFHPMVALIGGMVISLVGFFGSGMTNIGFIVALAIFVFAIGEMWCSPKFSEYIGLTAPADKKALYMGYSNIPFAVGWGLGNLISGYPVRAPRQQAEFRAPVANGARNERGRCAGCPQDKVMDTMAAMLNNGQGGTVDDATRLLWTQHHPWIVWVILGGIGTVATVFMLVYYLKMRNRTQPA